MVVSTHLKNMLVKLDPTNHPFRKENDLPNLHEESMLLFQGVNVIYFGGKNKVDANVG